MAHDSPDHIEVAPGENGSLVVSLDNAFFVEDEVAHRWVLAVDEGPAIDGDWDDWVALANHIVAIDEVMRREEAGEL